MSEISAIKNTPDISFIDGKTVDDVQREMIADFEDYMTRIDGRPVTLGRASVHRAIINAAAVQIYLAMQYVDRAGKQNLLKYAYGDFLDNLALLRGVERTPATAATTTLKFTASAARASAISIPQGTRVASAGGTLYFKTVEYAEIPAGSTTVTVAAVCTESGAAANSIAAGELTTIVDPVPYVSSVTNTTDAAGGAEVETDDALKERIYLAPGAYSTAGAADAYIYHAKRYSAAVGDVVVSANHDAGTVNIVFLNSDGTAPGTEMIQGLTAYLSAKTIRPLTDKVVVAAPANVSYSISLTYYISREDSAQAENIQAAVNTSISQYTAWQRTIGRDINPSKLTAMVIAAGAKRVVVSAPAYTKVAATSVANLSAAASVTYGGLEDD